MSDHDFNTPPWFLDLIRPLGRRRQIGLDPCSNRYSHVNAATSYTITENGLTKDWRGYGLVFVNPPHSQSPFHIEPWMEKAVEEFILKPMDWHEDSDALVMLIPAKTDTRWFHDYVPHFSARCFLKGRPKYWHLGQPTSQTGKFASMVLYHGRMVGLFTSIFSQHGWMA